MKKPGFIDLQLNGSFGVDFSDPATTVDEILDVSVAILENGTRGFLATIITGPRDAMQSCVRTLATAIRKQGTHGPLLGIHLEGPFISPLDGYRGAHPVASVIPPDIEWFRQLQKISEGNIRIVTLAPEYANSADFIRAVTPGVIVGAGHTACSYAEARSAVESGLTFATHIGNACLHTVDRHNNPIVNLLACTEIVLSFIADGFHLPESFIRMLIGSRPVSKLIAVSDAVKYAGMKPGRYRMSSGEGVILSNDGRLCLESDSYIMAGSSFTLLQCMDHLASLRILSQEELWQVGYLNPLRLLGRNPAEFEDSENLVEYDEVTQKFKLLPSRHGR